MKSGLEPSTEEHSKLLNFSCNLMRDETVRQEWQFLASSASKRRDKCVRAFFLSPAVVSFTTARQIKCMAEDAQLKPAFAPTCNLRHADI